MKTPAFILAAILIALATPAALYAQSTDTYQYDALGRLVTVQTGAGAKSAYTFDRASNRTNVTVVRQLATVWEAEALPHLIGFSDADGWAVNTQLSGNYMTYGPYTTTVPVGPRTATWRMMVDNNTFPDSTDVVAIDVYDSTAGEVLARQNLNRHAWSGALSYQIFELPFMMTAARAGHAIEMRTYYYTAAYVRIDKIGYY